MSCMLAHNANVSLQVCMGVHLSFKWQVHVSLTFSAVEPHSQAPQALLLCICCLASFDLDLVVDMCRFQDANEAPVSNAL